MIPTHVVGENEHDVGTGAGGILGVGSEGHREGEGEGKKGSERAHGGMKGTGGKDSSAGIRTSDGKIRREEDFAFSPAEGSPSVWGVMKRRRFLHLGAAGLGASILTSRSYAADFGDMKPRVGLIGAGWYGKVDLLRLIQVAPVEVVGLCDVDSKMAGEAADLVALRQVSKKKPQTYGDYRKMLDAEELDIVLVGTPDHWHALPTIAALEAGADVFVQKPISVDIVEGQAMLAAARKHNRVVQVGTQRRSTPHLIDAKKRIIE